MTRTDPTSGRWAPPVVALLESLKSDLARKPALLAPRTINHNLIAVKRMFNWSGGVGLTPTISWRGVRPLPVEDSDPEDLTPRRLFAVMKRVRGMPGGERVLPWLALNYLCVARPSEIVTLVNEVKRPPTPRPVTQGSKSLGKKPRNDTGAVRGGGGRFMDIVDPEGNVIHGGHRGLYRLGRSKNSWRGGARFRFLVLSPQALAWLDLAEPVWSRLDGYSAAACAAMGTGLGPRVMRDSAATHLRQRGVVQGDVSILLGHAPQGEWPSYARTPWPALLESVSRISL